MIRALVFRLLGHVFAFEKGAVQFTSLGVIVKLPIFPLKLRILHKLSIEVRINLFQSCL